MASNVYFGASFASPYEVEQAVLHGLDSQLLWGSDYPHLEGTFVYPEGREAPSVTRLALRNTFCGVAGRRRLRMVGGNAIEVYNLDAVRPAGDRSRHRRADPRRAGNADRRGARRGECHARSGRVPAAGAEHRRLQARDPAAIDKDRLGRDPVSGTGAQQQQGPNKVLR